MNSSCIQSEGESDLKLTLGTNRGKHESKQRRLILSEEDYTGTLTSIITRDYFPAIPALNRDAVLLQKRAEGDISSVIAIRRDACQAEAREELLNQLEETEEIIALHHSGIRKRARPLERETVDGFHQRAASEDNAEFEENMRREVSEKRQRMDLIYQTSGENFQKLGVLLTNSDNSGETRDTSKDARKLNLCNSPLLASDYFNAPVERIQCAGIGADGNSRTNRNALFFTPDHLENSAQESPFDKSEGSVYWPKLIMDDSTLMPPPMPVKNPSSSIPVIDSLCNNVLVRKTDGAINRVEYIAKPRYDPHSTEKMIVPSNTRFKYQNSSRIVAPCCIESIDIASNETASQIEYETETSASTDLDATPMSISMERQKRIDHKERIRNTFVAMTPTIIPGTDNDSPIVTWGRVASTPLALGSEGKRNETSCDENVNISSFQLPQENKKEIAAKRAEQLLSTRGECYKQSRNKVLHETPMEKSQNDETATVIGRASSLTPAARSLLESATPSRSKLFLSKSSVEATPRSSSSFGTALRNSYASSSSTTRFASGRSQKSSTINKATPILSSVATIQPASFLVGKSKDCMGRISTSGLLKK